MSETCVGVFTMRSVFQLLSIVEWGLAQVMYCVPLIKKQGRGIASRVCNVGP